MNNIYGRKFTDDEMGRVFKCFDIDNSGKRILIGMFACVSFFVGYITVNELRAVLRKLDYDVSEQQIRRVLHEVDMGDDGKISYEEFVRMLQQL